MVLEEILITLYRFGEPAVFSNKDGWSVNVDMHVNATGAKFSVRSEYKCATPTIAAEQCLSRVREMLGEQHAWARFPARSENAQG